MPDISAPRVQRVERDVGAARVVGGFHQLACEVRVRELLAVLDRRVVDVVVVGILRAVVGVGAVGIRICSPPLFAPVPELMSGVMPLAICSWRYREFANGL